MSEYRLEVAVFEGDENFR